MRSLFRRTAKLPEAVVARAGLSRGEKVLAGTRSTDGTWLLGTRDALVLLPDTGPARQIPWEEVQEARWSTDDDRLTVSEVGDFGRPRPVHTATLEEPGSFLAMLRERVTASVVLQRRVEVDEGRGLKVVARRSPTGDGPVTFAYELDDEVDPDDPEVRAVADAAVRAAAEELGLA